MISLLWPCVMLSGPLAAELPQTDETLLSQRKQQIETSLKSGNLTPLQAEFMLLANRNFDSPRDRLMAMREWQAEKGAALEAEEEKKHSRLQPQREAQRAEARSRRAKQISQRKNSGALSPLQADLMTLLNQAYETPQARHQALRAWQMEHGAAYDAERAEKVAALKPNRDALRAHMRTQRQERIDKDIASGRLGPLEGEFRTLMNSSSDSPQERNEELRAWLADHGDALTTERNASHGH